jgi:hypothetical protein
VQLISQFVYFGSAHRAKQLTAMKIRLEPIDATPSKRLYLSIIADYDVNKAICELVDNALDIWVLGGRARSLKVDIVLDEIQQRIYASDDAGGIKQSDLHLIVAPGYTGNPEHQEIIGMFGVGTKRAVVALAQEVRIRTRHSSETFQVEFNDDWIKESENWFLPVDRVDNIPRGTTQIELTRLRKQITAETVSHLRHHLSTTYARFLKNKNVTLTLNGKRVRPITFDNWAYPPSYQPRAYAGTIHTQDGQSVRINAIGGLTLESSPGGDYGVYFYCNDRLVARSLTTYEVGFTKGFAGKPHADISLTRVVVFLNGDARLMPWNSSKSDINTSDEVFVSLRSWLLQVVKDYASLSRRLSKFDGGWPEHVFRYTTGVFTKVKVADFPSVNTSYLPPLPESKPRYSRVVQQKNEAISDRKPWTIGIYESIVAVDWVLKQNFTQKNRIALILLDSTLEIAFKEYLLNESGQAYSAVRFQQLFSNRTDVQKEVAKFVAITQTAWRKINHYYRARNQLVHQRSSGAISDPEIANFRKTVERVLSKLFGLKF